MAIFLKKDLPIYYKFAFESLNVLFMPNCLVVQWLWRSWQSGRFQYQRTQVRIQSSATFIEHVFTVNFHPATLGSTPKHAIYAFFIYSQICAIFVHAM